MTDKQMTVGDRISHIKDEIIECEKNFKEAKRLGGHSCYAAGFEAGLLGALVDELEFLEGVDLDGQ